MARVTGERPLVARKRGIALVAHIVCRHEYGLVLKLPWHAAFLLLTFGLGAFPTGESAIHADTVTHAEGGRVARALYQLRLWLIGAGGYPHLTGKALWVIVGQLVYHALQVAGSVAPRGAVARTTLLDVAYATDGHGLVLKGTDIYRVVLYARITIQVYVPISCLVISLVVTGIHEGRGLYGFPCPQGITIARAEGKVGVETRLERWRTEVRTFLLVVLGGEVDIVPRVRVFSVCLRVGTILEVGACVIA